MIIDSERVYTLVLTEEELDAIGLAVRLMLDQNGTHAHWINLLKPIEVEMSDAMSGYEYDE